MGDRELSGEVSARRIAPTHAPTLASVEFEQTKCTTRRERFLSRIEALVPWEHLEARVAPIYTDAGQGRQPYVLIDARETAGDPAPEHVREDRRTLDEATDRYRTIVQAIIQALEPSKERSE